MPDLRTAAPDSTAVRVALSRAMHLRVDPAPHVLEDEIGLKLAEKYISAATMSNVSKKPWDAGRASQANGPVELFSF